MRDFDIPNVLKVKNPGAETFSLAGLFNLAPGKVTDVQLGALHDSRRATAYASVLNSIAGGVIEFVSGPENFKLPTSVANAISRREKIDAEGIVAAQRASEALANRPDGTPTLPTIKPPSPQPVSVPPACNPVGSDDPADFVPPPPPTSTKVSAAVLPPPPPAPAPTLKAPAASKKAKADQTPDSDPSPPVSPLSDL
jgi:hypothetical protein